jgi:NAD(P)-dependent dehydrogenase (short-subunit alcohol dehydrogenase family)
LSFPDTCHARTDDLTPVRHFTPVAEEKYLSSIALAIFVMWARLCAPLPPCGYLPPPRTNRRQPTTAIPGFSGGAGRELAGSSEPVGVEEAAVNEPQHSQQDPTTQHPTPEFPAQDQPHPGWTGPMDPPPDHGEESYRGAGRLDGLKTVITGGDSGIGRAVALAFAREGADVAIAHLPEEQEDGDETVRLVQDAGRKALSLPGDVTDEAYCRDIVEQTVAQLGGLDILVNNAAYQMAHEGLEDISTEELEHTFRTNIFALFHTCKAALPHMQTGSAIINTASEQAYDPSPSLMAYAATKAAIVNFTKNLAAQVLERGIRVNAVAPGPIWTPLIPATMPPDEVETFGQQAPIGRAGQPVEVAPAFVYLASDESSYVSAEILAVTGGTPLC